MPKVVMKCLCGKPAYVRGLCHSHYTNHYLKTIKHQQPDLEKALADRYATIKELISQEKPVDELEYPDLFLAFRIDQPRYLSEGYKVMFIGYNEWFDKNHSKLLTNTFCEWWLETEISPADAKTPTYFTSLAYAIRGWREGRKRQSNGG